MGNLEYILNGKLSLKAAYGLIWLCWKGTPYGQLYEDYPYLDREFINSILTGLKGTPLRKKLLKMWEIRDKKKEGTNGTIGEYFERVVLGWKKGGSK